MRGRTVYGPPTLVHLRKGRECSSKGQLSAEVVLVSVTGRWYSQGSDGMTGMITEKIFETQLSQ